MSNKKYAVVQKIKELNGNPVYIPAYRTDDADEATRIANFDPQNNKACNVCGEKDFYLKDGYWKSFDL